MMNIQTFHSLLGNISLIAEDLKENLIGSDRKYKFTLKSPNAKQCAIHIAVKVLLFEGGFMLEKSY